MDFPFYREYELPWTNSSSQERKFRRLLRIVFGAILALGVIWPWIPTMEPDPNDVIEIPPRIAKLLLQESRRPLHRRR